MSESAAVRIERDGPVFTVILARPEVRNAVDGPTARRLADAFRAFDADADAAVAVLWGEGGTFCAGADLKSIGTERGNTVTADGDGPMGPTRMRLGKPVIAAVAGHAVVEAAWSSPPGVICGSPNRMRSSGCSAADGECHWWTAARYGCRVSSARAGPWT